VTRSLASNDAGPGQPEVCRDPVRRPVMRQRWADLAFLHWPVDESEVQARLPVGLRPDLHAGTAWVGLVPFEMRRLRVPATPALPWLSRFVEVNVRTYVRDRAGRPGVWFDSLDASRLGAILVARTVFGLPYCWSQARYDATATARSWTVARRWPHSEGAATMISVAPRGPRIASALDRFLTARWGMYTRRRSHLFYGPISHRPWPLHDAELLELDDSLVRAAGYSGVTAVPHVVWSPGVDVAIGGLVRVE
jgi:uncharacterized protein